MVSVTYFASAFQTFSAIGNLPSSSHETSRKRKRELKTSTDDVYGEETELPSSDGELMTLSSVASEGRSLSQDTAFQYETSGHPFGETLPGSNFPHAFREGPTDSPQLRTKANLSDELAILRPPMCVTAGPKSISENVKPGAIGSRQQNLIALTAILHKCVLEGDFIRAGRAWGMLLRAEHNGHSLDLRTTDRWGLGAEIVLRRDAQLARNKDGTGKPINTHGTEDQHHMPSDSFCSQALEQAKNYYERLVLQYPYRKAFPDTTGPQAFYIAMFSLWIYSIQRHHSLALAEHGDDALDAQCADAWALNQGDSRSVSDGERRQHRRREAIRDDILQRANVIAARLGELTMSPPYSDDNKYLQLQKMLDSWIKDLSNAHGGS